RHLVLTKEPGRPPSTIFRESNLQEMVMSVCTEQRTLHFDQYTDIALWLESSDLSDEVKKNLYKFALAQTGTIREKMHIHYRSGRLVQLRRMALVVGLV